MSYPVGIRLSLLACFYGLLIAVAYLLVLPSSAYAARPALLSAALLFDLTAWPLLGFYWLIARPQRWSVVKIWSVGLGLFRLALWWVPNVSGSADWPLLLMVGEGTLLLIMASRFYNINRHYRLLRPTHGKAESLRGALSAVFGERVARFMLSEAEVIYYALLNWFAPINLPASGTSQPVVAITTHRQSGQVALLWGVLVIGLIELVAVHLLLARWWPAAVWWVSSISGYGCLLLLAIINTIQKRPSYLTADTLHLRLDLRWRVSIHRDQIAAVTMITDQLPKQAGLLNAALLTTPNLHLTFREPLRLEGLYGIQKVVTTITLFVDDRQLLINHLTKPID